MRSWDHANCADSEPDVTSSTVPKLGDRLVARLDWGAYGVALVFWAASLTPTLLPRTAFVQGGLTAILTLIGYGLGGLALRVFRFQRRRTNWFTPSARAKKFGRFVAYLATGLLLTVGTFLWWHWQNAQRTLIGEAPEGSRAMFNAVFVGLVVALVLLVIARLIAGFFGWIMRFFERRIGAVGARIATAVLVVLLAYLAFNQLIVNGIYASVNSSYEAGNATTDPGVYPPKSPLVSGGPGSLTPWKTLGLQGRNFAGGVTSLASLQKFAGPGVPVTQPIRVYAGLDSAPTPEARAQLAVKELERTGGFSRPVLVIATATGTGWINPYASAAVEYLWHGDSAIVSMQYSYLPSWIAFLTERSNAATAGRDLINAVYDHWKTLPAGDRPELVVYGESLGSYGAEAGLAKGSLSASLVSIAKVGNRALFVGPTEGNPIWRQIRSARHSPSPVWRPVIPASSVNAANIASEIPTTPSQGGRIQYVVHGSDPVGWWSMNTLLWPPAWILGPTPPGVPSNVIWFPVVTWLQTAADLMAGFSAPIGYGHNYNDTFAQGFVSVAPPPGWNHAETEHLIHQLEYLNELEKSSSNS